ncbi:hypothetical protein OSB04_008602 [Centaurea solstitialis]|uniref:Reverse transcriptase zinc-binding domain-containing protein n=1 Tax=Centaurea solstitialis TaxID=347529 RepID=A0AA38U5F8_9ASTR|nr:hypothetical protein OSB04_008602 [Centaurea solstitialis]
MYNKNSRKTAVWKGLEAPFTELEIKTAVWNCGYNKAPGPDGFTLEFVRKFWNVVGMDFVEAVKYFEQHKKIDPRNTVISNTQTAYIKGRSILDGPLMVNELISWAKKVKKKLLLLKVDFAKAFDSLNWNFLDNVLSQMGFGEKWRDWMREGLAVVMKEAQRARVFRGISFNNLDEDISLFQFADDAIFVGDWSLSNAKNLLRILKCFEICSGLKINMGKSRLSGVSVSREEVSRMARRLDCKEESIPFRYLGLPVGGNMNLVNAWQPLIDKFKVKLSNWKAKNLSIGGRCCLCKSVLGALGTYLFSLYKAPKAVLNQLESIRRKFLWGGTDVNKRISWIAWDKVIRDKKSGGLGIGSLRALNLSLLMKWRWREKCEPHALWNKVIQKCAGRSRTGSVSTNNRGTWKSIVGVEKDLCDLGINVGHFMKQKEDGSGWTWEIDSRKVYTVRSLRRLIDAVALPIADEETEWIRWVPSKINILLWRMDSNRLPTRDNLHKRGVLMQNTDCPFCHTGQETLNHLMITCSTAQVIHAMLASWVDWWPRNVMEVADFRDGIRRAGERVTQADVCKVIGAAFLSTMWTIRNNMVFKGEHKKDYEIVREIQSTAFMWIRCRSKLGILLSWDNWLLNPANAVSSCIALASC